MKVKKHWAHDTQRDTPSQWQRMQRFTRVLITATVAVGLTTQIADLATALLKLAAQLPIGISL